MEALDKLITELLWSIVNSLWQLVQWILATASTLGKLLFSLVSQLWQSLCWMLITFIPTTCKIALDSLVFVLQPVLFFSQRTNFIVSSILSIVYIAVLACLLFVFLLSILILILLLFDPQFRKDSFMEKGSFQVSGVTQEKIEAVGLQAIQSNVSYPLQAQKDHSYSTSLLDEMDSYELESDDWDRKMICSNCGYEWKARRPTPPAKCASCSSKDINPVNW